MWCLVGMLRSTSSLCFFIKLGIIAPTLNIYMRVRVRVGVKVRVIKVRVKVRVRVEG